MPPACFRLDMPFEQLWCMTAPVSSRWRSEMLDLPAPPAARAPGLPAVRAGALLQPPLPRAACCGACGWP